MASSNSRLSQPIVFHRRTDALIFKRPYSGRWLVARMGRHDHRIARVKDVTPGRLRAYRRGAA